MSNDTNVTATPDGQGNNDAGTEGQAGTPQANTKAEERFLTQEQFNKALTARLADVEKKWQTKVQEARLAGATEAQADIDKLVEERLNARLAEKELTDTRAALAAEYGLTDAQVGRLKGSTPDELRADAEAIFSAVRKPAPQVQTGGEDKGRRGAPTFSRSELRDPAFYQKHRAEIELAAREGRITDD